MFRLFLAVVSVALVWSLTNTSAAQPKSAPAPHGRWPHETIKGYGETTDAARQAALNNAVDELAEYLRQQTPPLLDGQPLDEPVRQRLTEHLKAHLLADPTGEPGQDVLPLENDKLKVKSWELHFKESPNWASILQAEQTAQRQWRSQQRQSLTAWVLAVLAAGLVIGAVVARLDEWTRGRRSAATSTPSSATRNRSLILGALLVITLLFGALAAFFLPAAVTVAERQAGQKAKERLEQQLRQIREEVNKRAE